MRSGRSLPGLAAVVVATSLVLTSCGGDDSDEPKVPDGAVAVIGGQEIGKDELEAQVVEIKRAHPRTAAALRKAGANDAAMRAENRRRYEEQALAQLLRAEALEQEAADRGVEVSMADARARWAAVSGRQFKTDKQLRTFLGGQSEGELIVQLRLQMLAEAIYAQVAEEAGGGKQGEKAVRRYQDEFRKRWESQTACRDDIQTAGCPGAEAE